MNLFFNFIFLIPITVILTGCYGLQERYTLIKAKFDGTYDNEYATLRILATGARVFDGDPEPKFPDDPNDSLHGIDADNDGVRDDVEAWINTHYKTYNERMAWKSYARIIFSYLKDGGYDKAMDIFWKKRCLDLIYILPIRDDDYDKKYKEINSIIYSTIERRSREESLGQKFYGKEFDASKMPNIDNIMTDKFKICDFDAQDQDIIRDKINSLDSMIRKQNRQHNRYPKF